MDLDKLEKELRQSTGLNAAADSPEGRRMAQRLDNDALRKAVERGDAAALQKLLAEVLSTPDGRALAERVRKAVGET